jgi:CheY-like chemotaxis protein
MQLSLHVFLVDDDADDREIFASVMKSIYPSAVTSVAVDGLDALEKLEQWSHRPDVIFVDLNMPRMNGFDFLRHIREKDEWRRLPVIVYSTSSNPQDLARSRNAGATDYIVKGNDMVTITRDLSNALKKYHPPLSDNKHGK